VNAKSEVCVVLDLSNTGIFGSNPARGSDTSVYPKVSGLAVWWSENCKWYSSLPLGAVVSQSS
jgi:hypothetical protein